MNHFLSGAAEGYVKVPEQMSYILDFIQERLGAYVVRRQRIIGDAQAKAQEMLDRYNALSSMEDVVVHKFNLVRKRKAYSPIFRARY